ncbi:hypothetical protein ES319_A04G086900v1 [Gossypium barbadense]|uniref:Uncharacterized protein n=2 Tax=Gossypium TaxID=3633 RepID=A0A5J5W5K7_GOSBA|nr:hypothetical protein ES319_A04G086900v1 [Gossypium barbadense]TYH22085.1 hypothetical protein ES288_A04G098700v1 [Gossypium darwinii]
MRTQKRGTSCEIYPFRVKMHKFTHLERRLICFFFNQKKKSLKLIYCLKTKDIPSLNHPLFFFDRSKRSSSTAILSQASILERASPGHVGGFRYGGASVTPTWSERGGAKCGCGVRVEAAPAKGSA